MGRQRLKTLGLLSIAVIAGTIAAVRTAAFLTPERKSPPPKRMVSENVPTPPPEVAALIEGLRTESPTPAAAAPTESRIDTAPSFRRPPSFPAQSPLPVPPSITGDTGGIVESKRPRIVEIAQAGDSQMFSILMTTGWDVNAKDLDGRTALSYAAQSAMIHAGRDMIADLLHAGADVNHLDQQGRTPLLHALASPWGPHPRIVAQLVQAGADTAVTSNSGETVASLLATISDVDLRARLEAAIKTPAALDPVLTPEQAKQLQDAERLIPSLGTDPAVNEAFDGAMQQLAPIFPEVPYSVNDEPRRWVSVELNRFRLGLDGFRIRPPEGRWDMHWQWVYRAGRLYSPWYIVPVKGTMEGFRSYDRVTPPREFRPAHQYGSRRQDLAGGQLIGGNEYIIWFHTEGETGASMRLFVHLTPYVE